MTDGDGGGGGAIGGGAVAVPVLPVQDLERSIAWYERLGFDLLARFDDYVILGFDGTELHLVTHDVEYPPMSLSGAYLRVGDADEVFARWSALGAPVVAPPEDQPYGIREWATEDPDGNLWRIGSPAATLNPGRSRTPDVHDRPEVAGAGDDQLPARALGAEIRDEAHSLGRLLAEADDDAVRTRTPDGSWSALEHGVFVRDALTAFAERIVRTLAEHDPQLAAWCDEADLDDPMANESDVSAVIDDLGRNAAKVSEALRMVSDDDWDRCATATDGGRFTIEAMARLALDEVLTRRTAAERALG